MKKENVQLENNSRALLIKERNYWHRHPYIVQECREENQTA